MVPAGAMSPKIDVTLYDRKSHEIRKDVAAADLAKVAADGRIAWVDVTGLGDASVLETLRVTFDLPWLALEDVLHSPEPPKAETYGDTHFIVMRIIDHPGSCDMDQFSIFVKGRVVVTFQERPGDPFDPLRARLADPASQARQRGADYLVYRMLDMCVDSLFPELQRISETVERIEDAAIERPTPRLIRDLHALRRELRILERVALRTRDAVAELSRAEKRLFEAATAPYLRDVLDHATQAVDLSHFYTSVASDIGAFIVGSLDMRMNEVMKILAGVTVVFMPLSLIAGVYGMNFRNMPETQTDWGYFAVLALLGLLGAALTLWMWRIGWLRRDVER